MKKTMIGAAFFLLFNSVHVMAAGRELQKGQPRAGRNILSSQLPATLLADIKKEYKDYWITGLSEEGKEKHPDYFITLENADQIVQLHSRDAENWVMAGTTVKGN